MKHKDAVNFVRGTKTLIVEKLPYRIVPKWIFFDKGSNPEKFTNLLIGEDSFGRMRSGFRRLFPQRLFISCCISSISWQTNQIAILDSWELAILQERRKHLPKPFRGLYWSIDCVAMEATFFRSLGFFSFFREISINRGRDVGDHFQPFQFLSRKHLSM